MFNCAQTFVIDGGIVKQSGHICVSRIDLYFKAKPKRKGKNNKSGINNPGATIYLVPRVDERPDMAWYQNKPIARAEWDDIAVSDDASEPTTFRFDDLPTIKTNTMYAFVIAFDGADEAFELWKSKKGEALIDTGEPSPGSSTPFARRYFKFEATSKSLTNPVGGWRPFNSTDLKFDMYVARFAKDGGSIDSLVTANTPEIETPVGQIQNANFFVPARRYEYAHFDVAGSTQTFFTGETVYQHRPYWPNNKNAATVAVTNGSNVITLGSGYVWSNVFSGGTDPVYIVITSEGHGGGDDRVEVRRIANTSGNSATVTEKIHMTNSSAKFFIAPVATYLNRIRNARPFGEEVDLVTLVDSNANASVRFVNNCIRSVSINAGGTGYSNSDHLRILGFENVAGVLEGGYMATANLVTNSTGGITTLYLSNAGAGFTNVSAATFAVWANSTDLSAGSGATFTINVGADLYPGSRGKGISSAGAALVNAVFINIDIDTMLPMTATLPHANHQTKHRMPYYVTNSNSTLSGKAYFLDANNARDEFLISHNKFLARPPFSKRRVMPSWSNEWSILYSNGAPGQAGATGAAGGEDPDYGLYSNASVYLVDNVTIQDFMLPVLDVRGATLFEKYIINNDVTDEETDSGNAFARGIEERFRVAANAVAEDLYVYLTAYRPQDTEIYVYARLLSPSDSEPIEDKDWTKLEQIGEGKEVWSSDINERDFVELSYKLPQFPDGTRLGGTAETTEDNTAVTGTGTAWDTDLANGDVIRIYPELFPNNYMVAVINTVTNATHLVLETAVTNTGIVSDGLKVIKVSRPASAFSYVLNDNVARYYDSLKGEHDGFDQCQIKIVLTSNVEGIVPKVDSLQVIGVSA